MITKCARCGKVKETPPFGGHFDQDIIDTICDKCLDQRFPARDNRSFPLPLGFVSKPHIFKHFWNNCLFCIKSPEGRLKP